MPKPVKATKPAAQTAPAATQKEQPIKWPPLRPKKGLTLESILDDQIYIIDNLFSKEECEAFVRLGKTLKLEDPKPPGKDEATRTNFRFQTYDPSLSTTLQTLLTPYISGPSSPFSHPTPPKSLYPKIRMYHYPPSTFFGPHFDESTKDPVTGLRSRWTLLIYLTGAISDNDDDNDDGSSPVHGGSTIFWTKEPNRKGKGGESLSVQLRAGRAVLHKHGDDCLLHEGEVVRSGDKWILRSDLMY